MDKKSLSERDICTKFITPAVKRAGWCAYRTLDLSGERSIISSRSDGETGKAMSSSCRRRRDRQ